MTMMSDAFEKANQEKWHRARAERLAAPQPTRYERNRDRVLADLRLWTANKIAEYAAEGEIEQAVDDCLMALQAQGFRVRLKAYMLNPEVGTLASCVAWTSNVEAKTTG
jgi:hypothetical protein